MKLGFDEPQVPYDSGSQKARAWTEAWVRDRVYCPNCGNPRLSAFAANRPVADFFCTSCNEVYELKSQKKRFGSRVVDGAYRTMCERLASKDNPNLLLLTYDQAQFAVDDLFVVPKHYFVREMIEERKPLAATARRAGWVGCNIRLDQVPGSGKIFIVRDRQVQERNLVLAQWQRTLFLRDQDIDSRGWLVEVMACVEALRREEFQIDDVYAFEAKLRALYPNNKHVKQKIRQQLQRLRDNGYLEFVTPGRYRLRSALT